MVGQQLEARYVNEWLRLTAPNDLQWKRVRFGPLPDKELASAFGVALRWVDAVVFDGQRVRVIEAKLRPDLKIVTQLVMAREMFEQTPEFVRLRDFPREFIALVPRTDDALRMMAARENVTLVVYAPEWLKAELAKRGE